MLVIPILNRSPGVCASRLCADSKVPRQIRKTAPKMGGVRVVGFPLQEGQRLELGDFKSLTAADVAAGDHVVAPNHVGLGLGEPRPIAFIGVARQLRPLAANYPADLMFARLAAMRTYQGVGLGLVGFCEKFAFFHHLGQLPLTSRSKVFHTRERVDEIKN